MFEHIIVPLDGSARSETAVTLSAELAKTTGTDIIFISTSTDPDDRYASIEKLAAGLDVPFSIEVSANESPADVIVRRRREHAPTLVVMATHGHRPIGAAVLGSVGTEVVRRSGGPVMLVGPHYLDPGTRPSCIVVPLDGSQTSEAALPVSDALSAQLGVPQQLVQVIDPDLGTEWQGPPAETIVKSNHLARMAGSRPSKSWHVLYEPHPAAGIARYVEAQPGAPFVVMATHGRTGRALVTLGSVATQLLHRAIFPVLLIRPSNLDESTRARRAPGPLPVPS